LLLRLFCQKIRLEIRFFIYKISLLIYIKMNMIVIVFVDRQKQAIYRQNYSNKKKRIRLCHVIKLLIFTCINKIIKFSVFYGSFFKI
jgi:hypothetical protein